MISWATPLLVLPGVGLLVMSTSARFARLHDELHLHLHDMQPGSMTLARLMQRARLFRNTLLALYGSAALLAMSGLIGGLELPESLGSSLLGTGVALLVVASLMLMRETTISLEVLEDEVANAQGHHHPPA